jgi:hypothetical protein
MAWLSLLGPVGCQPSRLAYAPAGIVPLVPITPGGLGLMETSLSGVLMLARIPGRHG